MVKQIYLINPVWQLLWVTSPFSISWEKFTFFWLTLRVCDNRFSRSRMQFTPKKNSYNYTLVLATSALLMFSCHFSYTSWDLLRSSIPCSRLVHFSRSSPLVHFLFTLEGVTYCINADLDCDIYSMMSFILNVSFFRLRAKRSGPAYRGKIDLGKWEINYGACYWLAFVILKVQTALKEKKVHLS